MVLELWGAQGRVGSGDAVRLQEAWDSWEPGREEGSTCISKVMFARERGRDESGLSAELGETQTCEATL